MGRVRDVMKTVEVWRSTRSAVAPLATLGELRQTSHQPKGGGWRVALLHLTVEYGATIKPQPLLFQTALQQWHRTSKKKKKKERER